MDNTGEQLHPNWRALATVHIPLKRFIKEGTQQTEQGTHSSGSKEKYQLQGNNAEEVKEFYEELVSKEKKPKSILRKQTPIAKRQHIRVSKQPFDVNKFHRYAMENQVELLKEMDFHQQDINICDNYGWTALMMAACAGSLEAVKFLLELGINKELKDRTGLKAIDLARKKGHFHIEQLLLKPMEKESFKVNTYQEQKTTVLEPFFCEICQRRFTDISLKQHQTSTVHQFNMKSAPSTNKLQKFNIPPRNRGLQLMVKQGWDKESGLGPSNSGRLYPLKTVIRKQRTGLGIDQTPARVTHFQPYDRAAVQRHNSDYYQKKPRSRNDMRREKIVEWKRDRRLRNELN